MRPAFLALLAAAFLGACSARPSAGPTSRPADGEPRAGEPTIEAGPAPASPRAGLEWAYRAAADGLSEVVPDRRLVTAAEALLGAVLETGTAPGRADLARAVREAGVAEPVPALLVITGTAGPGGSLERALGARLGLRGLGGNRVGIAVDGSDAEATLVALAMASRLRLDPVPARLEPGTGLRLRGEVAPELEEVEVLVATPRPEVVVIASSSGRVFDATFVPTEPGRHRIEVLARRRGSPEVLANFVVEVGAVEGEADPPPEGRTTGLEAARARLHELLDASRANAGLAPLAEEPTLMEVAAAYAEDMATRGFFGHVDPEGSGPWDRIAAAGLRPAVVLENLARAPTAEEAHAGLVESPAHLRSMLAPDATHAGIGVFPEPERGLWVVQLIARILPPVGREEGRRVVLEALATLRRAHRIPPLVPSEPLDSAARATVEAVADGRPASAALDEARSELERSGVRSVRALVVRTAELGSLGELEPARDPTLLRVGVDVAAGRDGLGGYHVAVLLAE